MRQRRDVESAVDLGGRLQLGVPVLGVDDRGARYLPLACQLGIPILIGDGTERRVLEKLRVTRSQALVAVGSDDLDNISEAVAASTVSPTTKVVLRAGEQEIVDIALDLVS